MFHQFYNIFYYFFVLQKWGEIINPQLILGVFSIKFIDFVDELVKCI